MVVAAAVVEAYGLPRNRVSRGVIASIALAVILENIPGERWN